MKTLLPLIVLTLGAFANAEEKEIEALIEQLASPNAPLNPKGDPFNIPIPPGYDEKAQDQIERTVEELEKKGKAAFPHLIKHRNDRRYCRSYPTSIMRDFTVGETCMEILYHQVDSFAVRSEYKGMPTYSGSVIFPDPVGWWKIHSNMNVREIRIDALKWTINAEKKERGEEFYQLHAMTRIEWQQRIVEPLQNLLKAEQTVPSDGHKPASHSLSTGPSAPADAH
jgi:hypothetical protein